LLLVDNKSNTALSASIDLSWHPNGRHIVEEETGLTPARIKGIKEAHSDLLLFVDDDNCLNENYLEIAVKHMHENKWLAF
jgi:glycosyltransferase involved in cell wall biosynthesis